MPKLMISVPSFDRSVKSMTAEAIGNLDTTGFDVIHSYVSGYSVARARNLMAQKAIDEGCDYLLMVDSDMLPPKDGLINLASHDVEVCLGWAVRGSSDDGLTSVIKDGSPGYEKSYYANEIVQLAESGEHLIRVKGCGMAFALLSTDVFRRFKRPWFKYVDYPNGSALGEDYYFCHQCHSVGLRVHVDTRVGCGHIHDRVLEAR